MERVTQKQRGRHRQVLGPSCRSAAHSRHGRGCWVLTMTTVERPSSYEALLELLGRPSHPGHWRSQGACRAPDVNPDWFFPERGESVAEAREVCRTCPVIGLCREFGLGERHGIWGGLSERERRRIRRQRGLPDP